MAQVIAGGIRVRTGYEAQVPTYRGGSRPPRVGSKEGRCPEHDMNLLVRQRRDPRSVAPPASPGTDEGDSTCSFRVPARTSIEHGPQDLPQLSSQFSFWCGTRPKRVHERDVMFEAAEDSARGQVPTVVCRSLMLATMTALQKRDGGVRGIRVPTELNPHLTVLSIDGVGAYDHVYRASMLAKLVEVPGLRALLPFVKTACSRASSYVWADEVRHTIEQHEGGEQGDPSCLCCSVWALEEVRQSLEEGECLFAYLDDVSERTRIVNNMYPDAHWQDSHVEFRRRTAPRHGNSWT